MKWIIPAYVHLHEKYWGEPVTLIAEADYSHGKFNLLVPPDNWLEGGYIQCHSWCAVHRWTLEQIDDKYIIFMLGDYMITSPVDTDAIAKIIEYMDQEGDIMRCDIGGIDNVSNNNSTYIDSYKGISIYEGNFLPTSLTPSIWDREKMIEMIPAGGSAWDFESVARLTFAESGYRSICPFPTVPVRYVNAMRARDFLSMVTTPELLKEIGKFIPSDIKTKC